MQSGINTRNNCAANESNSKNNSCNDAGTNSSNDLNKIEWSLNSHGL